MIVPVEERLQGWQGQDCNAPVQKTCYHARVFKTEASFAMTRERYDDMADDVNEAKTRFG